MRTKGLSQREAKPSLPPSWKRSIWVGYRWMEHSEIWTLNSLWSGMTCLTTTTHDRPLVSPISPPNQAQSTPNWQQIRSSQMNPHKMENRVLSPNRPSARKARPSTDARPDSRDSTKPGSRRKQNQWGYSERRTRIITLKTRWHRRGQLRLRKYSREGVLWLREGRRPQREQEGSLRSTPAWWWAYFNDSMFLNIPPEPKACKTRKFKYILILSPW